VITIKRLDAAYLIRGSGPCNWAQVGWWPCDDETLREGCFPEASDAFVRELIAARDAADEEVKL
jgi:hypothetical protein